ncbi:MAG TPA: STAS domain-containing protein [Opitutus sp.]|nr:STAS domain-containing protein [Opitutus sp.]
MEITRQKSGDILTIKLVGRLDANWCNHVQNALAAAVRDGEHRLHLDLAGVAYISSAGLRVLLSVYKQLRAINGIFGVVQASPEARSVLELAGLEMLITSAAAAGAATGEQGAAHASASARYELFRSEPAGGVRVAGIGDAMALRGSGAGLSPASDEGQAGRLRYADAAKSAKFGADAFALGVGALGANYADGASRFGEFLAVAGVAAFQPSDGSSRPDFVVSQGALVPEGHLLVGLSGAGNFSLLARFEATAEARTVGLTELAQTALALSGADAAAIVGVTETSCLVGASLRQSPAAGGGARFTFPQIRDWLSFTSERAFRDSTSLLVGVVAKPGTALDPLLRPLGRDSGIVAHVHAASFPYRPLRKGRIEMKTAVNELFDGQALQAVLHLLADPREFNGAGQGEFFRGALWIASVQTT